MRNVGGGQRGYPPHTVVVRGVQIWSASIYRTFVICCFETRTAQLNSSIYGYARACHRYEWRRSGFSRIPLRRLARRQLAPIQLEVVLAALAAYLVSQ